MFKKEMVLTITTDILKIKTMLNVTVYSTESVYIYCTNIKCILN